MSNFVNKKYLSILASLFLLLGFIYFSANVILVPDFYQGFSFPYKENDYCQKIKTKKYTPSFIEKKICKNELKKKKFLWFFWMD